MEYKQYFHHFPISGEMWSVNKEQQYQVVKFHKGIINSSLLHVADLSKFDI